MGHSVGRGGGGVGIFEGALMVAGGGCLCGGSRRRSCGSRGQGKLLR